MADGNIYYLQEHTNLSDLFEQFDTNDDLTPIIECSGFDLVLDEGCDAVNENRITPSGRQAVYNITIRNSGNTNKLILEDRSRIRLAASLPSNVCPWINPDKPLPYCDPLTGSYETGLIANARCEIQLNGNFGLGGGTAYLPTQTRPDNFWALSTASPTANQIKFNKTLNLAPGDFVVNIGTGWNGIQCAKVASYEDLLATFTSTITVRNTNCPWYVFAGGVVLNTLTYNPVPISNSIFAGTFNIYMPSGTDKNISPPIININRFGFFPGSRTYGGGIIGSNNNVIINQFGSNRLITNQNGGSANISEVCVHTVRLDNDIAAMPYAKIKLGNGIIFDNTWDQGMIPCGEGIVLEANNMTFKRTPDIQDDRSSYKAINSTCGSIFYVNSIIEKYAKIHLVLRSNFPVDTDIPDCLLYQPNSTTYNAWRFTDYYIRKFEKLKIAYKTFSSDPNSKLYLIIMNKFYWAPKIIDNIDTFIENGTYKEISFNNQSDIWQSNSILWTNNTGEDCQIRLWEIVTGSSLGVYLRTWRSSGGAL